MSSRTVLTLIFMCILVPNFWTGAKHIQDHVKNKTQNFVKTKKEIQTSPDAVKRQSGSIDYLNVPDPALSSDLDVTNPDPGNSSNLRAADRTGQKDSTAALQAIFDHASQSPGTTVYFPPGRYLVTSDLIIKGRVTLSGSDDGISLIETERTNTLSTTISYEGLTVQDYVDIHRLFFDGVRLVFEHYRIKISHCVFLSKDDPSAGAKLDKGQVRISKVNNSGLHHSALSYSLFLRDDRGFGVAVSVQSSIGISIENNIFGLDLGKIDWMGSELDNSYWPTLKPKLDYLKAELSLLDDQGFWKSAIYHGFNNDSVIEKNIFNGSPNFVRSTTIYKDHAAYLKGFRNLNFTENYVRGWDPDSSGGVKARNGADLVIARNYIDDTGILLYIHERKSNQRLPLFLKNVLVYGNHIVQRTIPGGRKSGIYYSEPHQNLVDENLVYAGNVFEVEGPDPTSKSCIFVGKRANLQEHHVYDDNVYDSTSPPVSVVIDVVQGTLQLKPAPAPHVPSVFVSMNVPQYNISNYGPPPSSSSG